MLPRQTVNRSTRLEDCISVSSKWCCSGLQLVACGAPKSDLDQNHMHSVVGMITNLQTVSSDAIGWVLIDIEPSVSVRSAQVL